MGVSSRKARSTKAGVAKAATGRGKGTKASAAVAVEERRGDEMAVLNAFRRILRLLRLSAVGVQAQVGISAAQLYILRQLAEERDGASINDLAEQTLTDRSSVASVVDRLAAAGLVQRSVSPEDRRRAHVTITPAGRTLAGEAAPPPAALLVQALASLSGPEVRRLARSLDSVVLAMGLEESPPEMLFEDAGAGPGTKRPGRAQNK